MHKSEVISDAARCEFAAELTMDDGQTCFMHTHACTEVIWYVDCSGWLPQGGDRLQYGPGSVAIYQPGEEHGDECENGGTQLCLGVTGGTAGELPAGMWLADELTDRVLVEIRQVLSTYDDWRQERLNALAAWLVLELTRQVSSEPVSGPQEPYHVTEAKRIMDTRFAEPLSIAEMAEDLRINVDYLRQLFVKWVGEPPMRYLIRKRLEAACDLLRLNQEKTADIAARVGIPKPHYFSRLFRQRMGVPPGQYRSQFARKGG
ncbi:MAG: helix-turn-helix domain-containing protein [Planctomycetota bacterium]